MSAGQFPAEVYRTSVAEAELIDEANNSAVVRPLVRAAEAGSSVSVTWVSLDGPHRQLASRRSARIYYVLSGNLTFVVGDGEPGIFGAGELLVIPKGSQYRLEGTGTYLVLNTPAFEAGDDEYTEADGWGERVTRAQLELRAVASGGEHQAETAPPAGCSDRRFEWFG